MQNSLACTQLCTILPTPACYEVFNDGDADKYTVDFAAGLIDITGMEPIPYKNIGVGYEAPALLCPSVAVTEVVTLTPVIDDSNCCNNTNLSVGITLQWSNDCGGTNTQTYPATVCCDTNTPTAQVTALKNVINGDPNRIVNATGTITLILTAITAGDGFTVAANATQWTKVITTANVIEFGSADWFINNWYIPASKFTGGANAVYEALIIKYLDVTPDSTNPIGVNVQSVYWKSCAVIVEKGGTAAQFLLSNSDKLCDILSGGFSDPTQYYAVSVGSCPC